MPSSRGMLYARLQLAVPGARSFLVAPVRSSLSAEQVAEDLASQATEAGEKVRCIDLASTPLSSAASLEHLREMLGSSPGLTIAVGGGLLDTSSAAIACGALDGIVLVAKRGKTSRADLEEARREIERAGGKLAGAVLLA